jgi:hypothetical protein
MEYTKLTISNWAYMGDVIRPVKWQVAWEECFSVKILNRSKNNYLPIILEKGVSKDLELH